MSVFRHIIVLITFQIYINVNVTRRHIQAYYNVTQIVYNNLKSAKIDKKISKKKIMNTKIRLKINNSTL
jgi:hypothetical protein